MSARCDASKREEDRRLYPGGALLALLSALLLALSFAHSVEAAPGDLDLSFGADGKVTTDFGGNLDQAGALAIQADGKIVVAGRFSFFGGSSDFALARYNPDGSLDTTFGCSTPPCSGTVITDFSGDLDEAHALAIQAGGRIVVAGRSSPSGSFGNSSDFALARYNPDGTLDTTFGCSTPPCSGTVTTDFSSIGIGDEAFTLALQADGKIVVAGSSFDGLTFNFALARYAGNGTLDTTFGCPNPPCSGTVTTDFDGGGFSTDDLAFALALQADGKIVVAGRSSAGSGFALARYNPNGTLDPSFGTEGKVTFTTGFSDPFAAALALAIQADGKIVVAGGSSDTEGAFLPSFLARYNPNGTLDPSFGTDGTGTVLTDFGNESSTNVARALAIQTDGKIVVGGRSNAGGSFSFDFALARYNSDGTLDRSFGTSGIVTTDFSGAGSFDEAFALALQADGKIVVTGSSNGDFALARYQGDSNTNTPTGSDIVVDLAPVRLIFTNVTQAGVTSLTTSSAGPLPPAGFTLGDPSTYYELSTTAAFSGGVTVCIDYSGIRFNGSPQLFHFENGAWVDVTISVDTMSQVICGRVTSLSPFALVEPELVPGRMEGDGRIDAEGTRQSFEFRVAKRADGRVSGELKFRQRQLRPGRDRDDDDDADGHRQRNRFSATVISFVAFSDDPTIRPGRKPQPTVDTVVFGGTGRWNGKPGYTFVAEATDAGEPGRGRDTFAITIRDPAGAVVATVSGTLSRGNIESRRLSR